MNTVNWLPPETRFPFGNTPLDYGSGFYGYERFSSTIEKNPELNARELMSDLYYRRRSIEKLSRTFGNIVQAYIDGIGKNDKKRKQIIWQEGTKKITIDDFLWYMRYENIESFPSTFNEERNGSGFVVDQGRQLHRVNEVFNITHKLAHDILKSISSLA